jgi:PAS domain S-box-containing protein
MGIVVNSSKANPAAAQPTRDSKGATLGLALMIVLMATVALMFGNAHLQIHEQSLVKENRWNTLRDEIDHLGDAIQQLNAPVNDVFESQNIAEAQADLERATAEYQQRLQATQAAIPSNVATTERTKTLATITAINQTVDAMIRDSHQVFKSLGEGRTIDAASEMAIVDRHGAYAQRLLTDCRREVREICQEVHEESNAQAKSLVKSIVGLGMGLLLIAAGFVWYGFRISRHNLKLSQLARQSALQLQAIMDSTVDPIVTINERGEIVSFNRAAEHEFGYLADQVLGQNVGLLMPDRYKQEHDTYLQRYLRTGQPKVIGKGREATGKRSDGSTFPVDLSISEVQLDGKWLFTGILRNIEDQKFAEAQLAKTRDEAEAANRAKSEFLANMSHEIRTPLTAILGYSEMLVGEQGLEKAPDDRRHALHTIRRNGQFLLELVNDILDLSRIEAGRLDVEQKSCSPASILADVASLMRVRADEKKLALSVRYENAVPGLFLSDPKRLRQVLHNLVGNAIKFTEQGSVQIVCRTTGRDQAKPRLEIDVVDTGIGINNDLIGTLFRPFMQGDNTLSRRFGGTGLGLCISKRLIDMLGGSIRVDSTPGVGTTFTISVPIVCDGEIEWIEKPHEVVQDLAPKAEPTPVKLDCRVLLVEDGLDNQRLISHLLKKAGADVTIANHGQEGIEVVDQAAKAGQPFDVILMDMAMPVLDGYQAATKLRQQGYTRPIIALTAHAMTGDDRKCLDAGCDDYATKPIERNRLIGIVAKHAARVRDLPVAVETA